MNTRAAISKVLPVRFVSHYWICNRETGYPTFPERATWRQWRGRVFRHHRSADFGYRRAP